ncbi:hypothetical protein PsorP6_017464 [Peronosclerospora sorghi]|uniref:Uncharacterized protein n=1 Tax=Peronosclerospora sorghi TaxID=230839 RepID=A0ACC0WLA6_9STRA|nr:hypothetical protein PsorP6_017464 [Peronosclerospora sorghi]
MGWLQSHRPWFRISSARLEQRFQIKDLGSVKGLLGMDINYDHKKRKVFITKQNYIEETTGMFRQVHARTTTNPCDPSTKLSSDYVPKTDAEKESMSRIPYRQLLGRLMFVATTTRSDAAFGLSQLGRFATNPGSQHWRALIKVLRYLLATINLGLHYGDQSIQQQLTTYSDADWEVSWKIDAWCLVSY